MNTAITSTPEQLLAIEEDIMKRSLIEVATALKKIRDERLWRENSTFNYQSFGDYCQRRMKISESRASQIITARGVMAALTEAAGEDQELKDQLEHISERAARELKGVPVPEALAMIRNGATKAHQIRRKKNPGAKERPKCTHCHGSGLEPSV